MGIKCSTYMLNSRLTCCFRFMSFLDVAEDLREILRSIPIVIYLVLYITTRSYAITSAEKKLEAALLLERLLTSTCVCLGEQFAKIHFVQVLNELVPRTLRSDLKTFHSS